MKLLIIILAAFFLILQYKLWFKPGSVWQVQQLKKQVAIQIKENTQLRHQNETIADEIKGLKVDRSTLETRARYDLNMVKPGESFYLIVNRGDGKIKDKHH